MANTPTNNFGFLKPDRGDIDWDVPLALNWDKLDEELSNLDAKKLNGLAASGYATKEYVDQSNDIVVEDIASLKALEVPNNRICIVKAFGTYRYDSASTDLYDDRWIVLPDDETGRWFCESPGAELITDLIV